MSKARARQTVRFATPIRGSLIIEAVKKAVAKDDPLYYSQFESRQGYINGTVYTVGQRSGYRHKHLVVAATVDTPAIRPEAMYDTVEVMRYPWGGAVNLATSTPSDQREAISTLATALQEIVTELAERPAPEYIWPQEVEVCYMCHRIVIWRDDRAYCPVHEADCLTETIKVTPVEDLGL